MNVEFATCNKVTALGYLNTVYPTREVKETEVSKLLDLVEKDICRVRDPFMYGNSIAVIAGQNYKPEDKPEIDAAIEQLKENNYL